MAQFRIKSYHDVYEDHFEEGEGKHFNYWDTSRIIDADTPIEALRTYYEKEIYKIFNHENIIIDDMDIFDSFMVDEDCMLASDYDMEMFKKGERKLFVENIRFKVWQLTPIEVRL
jgi:hypothetical protein